MPKNILSAKGNCQQNYTNDHRQCTGRDNKEPITENPRRFCCVGEQGNTAHVSERECFTSLSMTGAMPVELA